MNKIVSSVLSFLSTIPTRRGQKNNSLEVGLFTPDKMNLLGKLIDIDNLYEKYQHNELNCGVCGHSVGTDTNRDLAGLVPNSSGYKLVCNSLSCFEDALIE